MEQDRRRRLWLWRAAVPLIALAGWQLLYHLEVSSRAVLPSPEAVWDATVSLQRSGTLWTNLWSTVGAALEALGLAAAVGIPVGIVLGMLPGTWAVLGPYLNALNSMPRIAFAPVLIVVFGIGQSAKIALGFSVAVFIFILNARAGVLSADEEHVRALRSLGASRMQLFTKLYLPSAVPTLFTAVRLGLVYSLLGVISSEILASRSGVGQLITSYSATLSMAYVYSLLIMLAIIASTLATVVGAVERRLLRWQRAGAPS